MRTVAVDFDGVIHTYERGWADGTIYGEPIEGAFDALSTLMDSYAVLIHTTRDPQQVADWLTERGGFRCMTDVDRPEGQFWDVQVWLLITNHKYPAVAYIDDRGIRFESWPQALADLAGKQAKARAVTVEIVERGRTTDDTMGGSLIVPNDVRINGVSVLTVGGVKVHEMDIGTPKEMATITLTLPVRLLTIAAEGDLHARR